MTLIHVSTDHVFDGTQDAPYTECDALHPVNTYGTSKAAGELAVRKVPRHYLLRTSRLIAEGENPVRALLAAARQGVPSSVVADQIGRLTFAEDLVAAIVHLRNGGAPYGTYHVTKTGQPASWADVARRVYAHAGRPATDVTDAATEEHSAGTHAAPRPRNSVLDLAKLEDAGFTPRDR